RLVAAGLVTPAGHAAYRPQPAPKVRARPDLPLALPDFLIQAWDRDAAARRHFEDMAPSYRRQYVDWLAAARREDTRTRRLAEELGLMAAGKKLGLEGPAERVGS